MNRLNPKNLIVVILLAASLIAAGPASAADEIKIASVSWTGVTVKSELAVNILKSLGYEASYMMVSVPIVYKALSMGEADFFLGNWMPSMANIATQFFEDGSVIKYVASMPGAKYTLAVPTYVYEAGLQDFSDIAKYAEKLDNKIYGIEEGNDGNLIIQKMIDNDMFGLGKFELIPSSEVAMLSEVQSFMREGKWVVFLGWAPHYMNEILDMKYLSGSTAETFGENDGTATIYTNTRKGFAKDQPNLGEFLLNFKFPIPMMNQIMANLHEDKHLTTERAGLLWIKDHPDIYKGWLDGVTTIDGKPALPAFEKFLATVKK